MSKLKIKILRTFTVITIIIAVLTLIITTYTVIGFNYGFHPIINDLKLESKKCVEEAVKIVDTDGLENILKQKAQNSTEYTKLSKSFYEYKVNSGVNNLYILVKNDKNTTAFVIDVLIKPAKFMEEYIMQDKMKDAFNGNISVEDALSVDIWGGTISAYAPIKNSKGEVIAILGADKYIHIIKYIKEVLKKIIIVSIILYITAFLVIMLNINPWKLKKTYKG